MLTHNPGLYHYFKNPDRAKRKTKKRKGEKRAAELNLRLFLSEVRNRTNYAGRHLQEAHPLSTFSLQSPLQKLEALLSEGITEIGSLPVPVEGLVVFVVPVVDQP